MTAGTRAQGRRGRRARRGVLYYLWSGLSAGLLGLVILLGLVAIVVPLSAGATPMTVLTTSMVPTYPPGTLVIVKPTPVDDIRVGDALTYQLESGRPEVVTHRVVSIIASSNGERSFVTKGDNNAVEDTPAVREVQVRGTVWYSVPWIGYLNNLVSGQHRVWLVPVVASGLLVYAGFQVTHWIVTAAHRRRANQAG